MRGERWRSRATALDVGLLGLALVWGVVVLARAPAWTVDDAYIVGRYAENAVVHGRLAFNLDGDRVEGFTSPLAMLLAIAARACGGDPIEAQKALGAAAYLASLPVLWTLAREMPLPAPTAGLATLVHASIAEHLTHATSGLETEAFTFATLLAVLAYARAERSERAGPLAAACALAALVRPEGILTGLLLAAHAWRVWRVWRTWRATKTRGAPKALGALTIFAFAMFALSMARLAYFGDLLPNTYYAKVGAPNLDNARSLLELVRAVVGPLALGAASVAAVARLSTRTRTRGNAEDAEDARVASGASFVSPLAGRVVIACVALLALQSFAYARSLPIMDYGRRFAFHGTGYLAPITAAIIAVAVSGARALAGSGAGVAAGALTVLAAVASVSRAGRRADVERGRNADYAVTLATVYAPAARWVLEHTDADATIAVYPDAGIVPHTTGRRTIDFGRLADRRLARARTTSEVVEYFFERRPDVLLVAADRSGQLCDDGATALVDDPRFGARYVEGARFTNSWGASLLVYARRGPDDTQR